MDKHFSFHAYRGSSDSKIIKICNTDHTSRFLVLYNLDVKSLVFLKNKYIVHVCIDTNIHLDRYIKERRWIHILTKKSILRGLKLRWDSKLVDAK